MKVLSLFGGVECGYPAFKELGIEVDSYYSCEIDEVAQSITRFNIPFVRHLGDVKNVDFSSLGEIDIVVGGSPCTYWSISKKGRETTSEGIGYDLFMQFVRAFKESGAKYFLYENNNSIHQDIKDAITQELGVELVMVNSSLLSSQSRRRCYWTNIPLNNLPDDSNVLLKDILEKEVADKYTVNPAAISRYIKNGKPKGFKSINEKANTVTASVFKGYGNDGCTVVLKDLEDRDTYKEGDSIRRLTPLECERLQTLPDNWTEFGFDKNGKRFKVSDTQRYRCVGNGWTSQVIKYFLTNLK